MWPPPLGPQVELPMGPRSAALGVEDACGHPHWGRRWSSLWGHETPYGLWRTHAGTPLDDDDGDDDADDADDDDDDDDGDVDDDDDDDGGGG
eukprot:8983089-Pyramimonas_sp.AAC.1